MDSNHALVALAEASATDRTVLGGKAAVLAELIAAGFPVPPGFVVPAAALDDPALDTQLSSLACRVRGARFAVRRCFAAAGSERVTAYHARHDGGAAAMAVLVQTMVDPVCAGVAFTAQPVPGDRNQTVVTAVA